MTLCNILAWWGNQLNTINNMGYFEADLTLTDFIADIVNK